MPEQPAAAPKPMGQAAPALVARLILVLAVALVGWALSLRDGHQVVRVYAYDAATTITDHGLAPGRDEDAAGKTGVGQPLSGARPASAVWEHGPDPARSAAEGAEAGGAGALRLVIGRTKDLTAQSAIRPNEYTLLNRLTPDLGSPKLNWYRNASVLRGELRNGITQVRDASPGDFEGQFLNAEPNLLQNRGWNFDPLTSTWNAPRP